MLLFNHWSIVCFVSPSRFTSSSVFRKLSISSSSLLFNMWIIALRIFESIIFILYLDFLKLLMEWKKEIIIDYNMLISLMFRTVEWSTSCTILDFCDRRLRWWQISNLSLYLSDLHKQKSYVFFLDEIKICYSCFLNITHFPRGSRENDPSEDKSPRFALPALDSQAKHVVYS